VASRASSDVVVRFIGDTGNLEKGLDGLKGRFVGVTSSLQGIAQMGAVVAGLSFFKKAIDEARDAERIGRKTEAVLKSTGQQAGVTADQVSDLAGALSEKVGVDDEVVQSGENVLLTFTKIRNEAGAGNDIFNQTTTAALNMSAAMDQSGDSGASLQENIVRVGKALNDPIKGMTALQKVGVTFTQQQKDQITALVESGNTLEAQKMILRELQTEFGGMAEASADSTDKAVVSWGNFAEAVGMKVMPAVNAVSDWALRTGIPALGNVADTVGDAVTPAFKGLGSAAKGLVDVWQDLPGPVQDGAIALAGWQLVGDRVTGTTGKMSGGLRSLNDDVKTAMGAFDVGPIQGTMMALEERIPTLAKMGAAWRENASAGLALSNTMGGVQGTLLQVSSVAKGTAAVAFSGLKSAASGLMGALGGPWGLALAGAAAGFSFLASRTAEAKARQQEYYGVGKRVAEILNDQGDATRSATKAAVAKELADKGLLTWGQRMGVSTDTLTSAYMGNKDALDSVEGAIRRARAAAEESDSNDSTPGFLAFFSSDINTAVDGVDAFADAYHSAIDGVQEGKAEQEAAAAAAREQDAATFGLAGTTSRAAVSQDNFKAVLAQTGIEYDDNKTGLQNLTDALHNYNTEQISAMDTEEGWHAALYQLTEGVKENKATLDINTEAGRANRDNLEELSAKTKQLYIDNINAGMGVDQATASYNANMQQVYDTARALGFNDAQARALIDTYGKVPPEIITTFSTKGYEAVHSQLHSLSVDQQLAAQGIAITDANRRAYNKQVRDSGYATGGPIFGPGTSTSDSILARVSNNEHVWTSREVDAAGGHGAVKNLRSAALSGKLPGFAQGGAVTLPFVYDLSKTKIPDPAAAAMAIASRTGGGGGGAGVQRWAGLVLEVLKMLGQSAALLPNVLRRMNQESGGNPHAVNLWDSNAKKGQPSQGLMQTIPGTFAAYAGPFRSRGIMDPLANIYAGLNYALHRYGSIQKAMDKPGGYKDGGWLMPGKLGYNETSTPEPILNKPQWNLLGRLIDALEKNSGQPTKVIDVGGIHVTNQPTDVMQQLRFAEMMAGV
jgi:hypothetical protein